MRPATGGIPLRTTGDERPPERDYETWRARYSAPTPASRVAIRRAIRQLRRHPLFSVILPVFDPDPALLAQTIEHVRQQSYGNWELCIADDASTNPAVREVLHSAAANDPRIQVTFREVNGHISAASNTALSLARGEWCALLDHDDLLHEDAFAHVAREVADHPDAGIIYSDEDKIDAAGAHSNPYCKGDWNHDLFLGQNFINHLGVYRASLLREVGGFREGFEGSQDYDLALRCLERLRADQVRHIPRVLYHWRIGEGSVAGDPTAKPYAKEAARRSIAEHLQRRGVAARVEPCPEASESHRVIYELPEHAPLVSMIIPTRDRVDLLRRCINSIRERSDYPALELVIVDNGSTQMETRYYLRTLEESFGARIVRDDEAFNFSRLMNRGAQAATGEVLALLNNDTEVENGDWLREMVSHAVRPGIGAVGARLWYPDGTLQHGGVVAGLGGVAGHAMYRVPRGHPGYFNNIFLTRFCTAVTAACLVVRKALFEEAGGFDELHLPVSFNDVDFCLRLRALGLENIWTPSANLTHHESASRGHHTAPEEQAQFFREATFVQEKWGAALLEDPFYNPNLTLDWPGFELAFPPRVSL